MSELPRDGLPVVLHYPLDGRFRVRNSPARRVPSHGTHLMGTTFAIDFVPVDGRGRSARGNWRAAVSTERPEEFVGFGRAVRAPASGTVVAAHDGEDDHAARRSPLALLAYASGQAARIRRGPAAIAGNHVVIALSERGPFALVAHLRKGSVGVEVGQRVEAAQPVGRCGNSGNSTQPHVHVQVTDSLDWAHTRGLPIVFATPQGIELPAESQIVDAGPADDGRP